MSFVQVFHKKTYVGRPCPFKDCKPAQPHHDLIETFLDWHYGRRLKVSHWLMGSCRCVIVSISVNGSGHSVRGAAFLGIKS
ncbi:hypothetical protein SKAU_G00102550 [Synaphobranchus kaupii]|uniref:Uncharacterized protein n=1 Tax=Synaphobranchus kaupii TaxID=118154 RepID=A0A9Q1FZ29_SYNKA|nr:hypothetical protein SKAU_G00102550 [Synaphobranchus kaupii]